MGSKTGTHDRGKELFQALLAHRPTAGKRFKRSREKRNKREVQRQQQLVDVPVAPLTPDPDPDPVKIAVLTLEYLSSASMRASFTGQEVRVAAPDAAIAAIFRAALSQTAPTRATDRLIRIVVA